ncbi:unnamed protein product [Chondrus crispus]|uniref:Amine oxidase domain-containing protein n=1 Tax=Chondrus crispus TaxID=2769 RepID=R7Q3X1_CHOCR|nr:unnamed protein product [Chondrus crispus]CDF32180.1 unnamed protein product [Chondrus crispus]|eukprot:XP_005711845.1 unnamed protein product [Chondrus crispus]
MAGDVYGMRDEVMARDERYRPSPNGVTWVTTYQLDGAPLLGRDEGEVARVLDGRRDAQVRDPAVEWIDFVPEDAATPQPEETLLTDYFPHFHAAELEEHLPWKVRDAQGDNSTAYVSSFTCFEAVLHIYLYQEMLMGGGVGNIDHRFPKDKKARIAVIGAGPSGILFASQHLVKNGYDNFVILEASDRFGGKTRTVHREAPAEPGRNVPCELGTCYLSLGYEPMFHLFEQYDAGQVVALDKDTNQFRSIIDLDVAKTQEERENGVEYGDWTLRKNGRFKLWEQLEMYVAGIRYLVVHYATMGMTMNDCMPVEPPTELNVLENLQRLLKEAIEQSDEADEKEVPAKDLLGVLKKEKREEDSTPLKARGLFDLMDDFGQDMDDVKAMVSVDGLKKACRNVLNTTFGQFLDDNDMDELRSVFTYGYQVQGYGTLDVIPAYYGMVWMTPAVLTGNIRQLFNADEAASQRGTVNVASKGWLTLWEKMVERDLKDKIVYNVAISSVDRVMD